MTELGHDNSVWYARKIVRFCSYKNLSFFGHIHHTVLLLELLVEDIWQSSLCYDFITVSMLFGFFLFVCFFYIIQKFWKKCIFQLGAH